MTESEEDNKKEYVYKVASRYDVNRDRNNHDKDNNTKKETKKNEKKDESKSPVKDYDNE